MAEQPPATCSNYPSFNCLGSAIFLIPPSHNISPSFEAIGARPLVPLSRGEGSLLPLQSLHSSCSLHRGVGSRSWFGSNAAGVRSGRHFARSLGVAVSLHLHLVMTNQGPAAGANCFAAPYLPLQAALERWFPVPGAAAHHLGCLYHRTGVVRASAAHCAWGMGSCVLPQLLLPPSCEISQVDVQRGGLGTGVFLWTK